jgi:hypothetical protein
MKLKILPIIILFLFLPVFSVSAAADVSIQEDIENISTKYSNYLDTQWKWVGWNYSVPSKYYREVGVNSANSSRMQGTLASAYNWRDDVAAKEKVRIAILDILDNNISKGTLKKSTRSFHDAIGLFMTLDVLGKRSEWFSEKEKAEIIAQVRKYFPASMRAADQENRAFLGAAFGLAILNHPLMNFSDGEKERYEKEIRNKIKSGLLSVGKDDIYREGKNKKFSLHYHLVSADCLMYAGKVFNDQQYITQAKKMLQYIHDKYPIKKLTWKDSERPTGIGLQTVLLRALGEKFLDNSDWLNYWKRERIRRGFIDLKNPNRLVWRDEAENNYNDDYSFLSMVVLFEEQLK